MKYIMSIMKVCIGICINSFEPNEREFLSGLYAYATRHNLEWDWITLTDRDSLHEKLAWEGIRQRLDGAIGFIGKPLLVGTGTRASVGHAA